MHVAGRCDFDSPACRSATIDRPYGVKPHVTVGESRRTPGDPPRSRRARRRAPRLSRISLYARWASKSAKRCAVVPSRDGRPVPQTSDISRATAGDERAVGVTSCRALGRTRAGLCLPSAEPAYPADVRAGLPEEPMLRENERRASCTNWVRWRMQGRPDSGASRSNRSSDELLSSKRWRLAFHGLTLDLDFQRHLRLCQTSRLRDAPTRITRLRREPALDALSSSDYR